jgi:hypothetical protein
MNFPLSRKLLLRIQPEGRETKMQSEVLTMNLETEAQITSSYHCDICYPRNFVSIPWFVLDS